MKIRPGKSCGLLVIPLLLGSVLGCNAGQQPKQQGTVKVGVLFPLTGDLADKGAEIKNAIMMAVDEINAAGGIKSLNGARLQIITADSQGHPSVGAREAERLIKEQKVSVIIGSYQSSVTKIATAFSERLETPFIISMGVADIITERGFRYTFRFQPKARYYTRDQARFLKDLQRLAGYKVRKVALIHENSDFGTAISWGQKQSLAEVGIKVVAEVSYAAEGVKDLSREVATVLASRPDAILEATYLKDSILIRRALAKAGSKVPLVDTAGGTVSPDYVRQLGPLADGTFTSAEFSKLIPGGKELNNRFRARFGVDITGDSAYAYQAVLVLRDALERAGSADRKKLRQALAETDLPRGPNMVLPLKRLRFNAEGQAEYARLYVVQIQSGEPVLVWPPECATADIRLRH